MNEQAATTLMSTSTRALLAICIGLSTASGACSDAAKTVAADTCRRTIPPGEPVPPLSEVARANKSAEFTWEFGTHLSATEYVKWLKIGLRDFQVVSDNGTDLYLGKQVDGDAYRLHLTLHGDTTGSCVQVHLTASPD